MHGIKERIRLRKYRGCKAWTKRGRGHEPLIPVEKENLYV